MSKSRNEKNTVRTGGLSTMYRTVPVLLIDLIRIGSDVIEGEGWSGEGRDSWFPFPPYCNFTLWWLDMNIGYPRLAWCVENLFLLSLIWSETTRSEPRRSDLTTSTVQRQAVLQLWRHCLRQRLLLRTYSWLLLLLTSPRTFF